ncbi:hypothetical protein DKX38_002100 [Salix brachista]|uniref:DNA-directed RNA polymerase subunit n=1 Tax=Salix brachista TaxID=2182728 RepID=A0A5N5NMP9_9ROSI|nr:hypothetical protein DKX38_002100 [Salix brachista]
MFYLSLIEHKMLLPPRLLNLPLQDAIKEELQNIFLDKVISKLGLCISIYDIRKIDGGFISPGEGASTYTVEFRMIVFRPFVGEIISAKLKESTADGLQLSLGFFDDITIPAGLIQKPSRHVPDPENRYKVLWVWQFNGEEFFVDGIDEIKFKVISVTCPPTPIEQQGEPFAPMVITVRFRGGSDAGELVILKPFFIDCDTWLRLKVHCTIMVLWN